jgi:hypothetical protein
MKKSGASQGQSASDFVDVDRAACVSVETRVEETGRILQRRAPPHSRTRRAPGFRLPSSGWLMRILRSIVAPSATLVAFCDSKMIGCGGIRSQLICTFSAGLDMGFERVVGVLPRLTTCFGSRTAWAELWQ